ncbi:ATP dependent DNA ligase domain-containing protein [Sporodiniella umbellata]|nr:ATP dependent DNA ligase domain-containing protein [Sporodiniella umbellata]
MRMFLPNLDKREYRLKEDALASRISISGDLSGAAVEIIRTRSQVRNCSKTIKETHEILDELANNNSMEAQVVVLKQIINTYTPGQIYWIIRIIVKDLKIGMTENTILTAFHKNAKDAFDCGQDLYYICKELADVSAKFSNEDISMFHPIIPQRGVKNVQGEFKKFDSDNRKMFATFDSDTAPYFYVEEKIDGDRMQLHYNPDIDKFMWFTRNQNDFTERFGSSSKDTGKLSSRIYTSLPSKRVVLDGEMVALDPKTDTILPFGTLRTSTQNYTQDTDEAQPYFIVFDILWFDDKLIMPYPLKDRILLLKSVIKDQQSTIKLIPRKKLTLETEIMEELNEAIKRREEGLMVKMPYASYQIKKVNSWLKFKPDYLDTLVENCDLLVVGAKYGTGRRKNCLAQFFCVIRDDTVSNVESPRYAISSREYI